VLNSIPLIEVYANDRQTDTQTNMRWTAPLLNDPLLYMYTIVEGIELLGGESELAKVGFFWF